MPSMRLSFAAVLALLMVLVPAQFTRADGLIIVDEPIDLPRPRPRNPPQPPHDPHRPPHHHYHRFAPLHVKQHHVEIKITDQTAVTSVDQTFFNESNQRLEGTYIFPIPDGAQISQFTMDINGEQVEAELLDADKARKIYEGIVRKMKDPALLEYAGRSMFKVRIFPIEPRSEKRITLRYVEVLERDDELIEYRYPLNTEKFSSRPIESLSVKCEVTTEHPLRSLYVPSHTAEITHHGERSATVGFEATDVRPNTDFKVIFSSAPASGQPVGISLLTYRDPSDEKADGFFMLLASPQQYISSANVLPKDILFVLDTSGSMAGAKLEQAKKALRFCIANLNDDDRFEIVRFSTETEALFDGLVEASGHNRTKANEFINELKPIGGTAINDALLKAIEVAGGAGDEGSDDASRPSMIIFLTDGLPTIGERDKDAIVKNTAKANDELRARVFCFGIGNDVNTHLLDQVASETRAISDYVLPEEDIELTVSSFYSKVDSPVMSNPVLAFDGVKATAIHPQPDKLPDVFKGEQLIIFGRYAGAGDAIVTVHGNVEGKPQKIVTEVRFDDAAEHEFIPQLWATRRVGWLLEQIRINGESDELKDEVVRLARQYGVVTPYTSYLIIEDETGRGLTRRRFEDTHFGAAAGRAQRAMPATASGGVAVDAARESRDLQQAGQASAPPPAGGGGMSGRQAGGGFSGGGSGGRIFADLEAEEAHFIAAAQQFVAGRTFYRQNEQWVDGTIFNYDEDELEEKTIEFGSEAYFQLVADHPIAAQWLAQGTAVQVRIDRTIYTVTAPPADDAEPDDETGG